MHFVCDPKKGLCADILNELEDHMTEMTGYPPNRSSADEPLNADDWPLMKACANCEEEVGTKTCSGCGITRYGLRSYETFVD
jgi:hypothetical protein